MGNLKQRIILTIFLLVIFSLVFYYFLNKDNTINNTNNLIKNPICKGGLIKFDRDFVITEFDNLTSQDEMNYNITKGYVMRIENVSSANIPTAGGLIVSGSGSLNIKREFYFVDSECSGAHAMYPYNISEVNKNLNSTYLDYIKQNYSCTLEDLTLFCKKGLNKYKLKYYEAEKYKKIISYYPLWQITIKYLNLSEKDIGKYLYFENIHNLNSKTTRFIECE